MKSIRMIQSMALLCTTLTAAVLCPSISQATPYATSLTNNAGTISFRLNESADSVVIAYTNLTGTLVSTNLGAKALGLTVTNLGVPGTYAITVSKSAAPGWAGGATLQISSDTTNTVKFNAPRGVAVNQDPASPYFGRIYVANALVGTANTRPVGDGIYLINSDFSDAVGQGNTARTAGITTLLNGNPVLPFTNAVPASTDDGNTPWHIEVGQDDNLYISDFSIANGTIYVTDPDVSIGTNIIAGLGMPGQPNASAHHGRIGSSVIARGSLSTGDLTLYAIDSDYSSTSDGTPNHIMKWPIGAGPYGQDLTVTNVDDGSLLGVAAITVDLDRGADGKFYLLQNRSAGGEPGICIVDPSSDGGPLSYYPMPDGLWDEIYDSYSDSVNNIPGQTNDVLITSRAVKISPDDKYMAVIRDDNKVMIVPLIDGLPNLAGRVLMTNGVTTIYGRDITFDAAGNIYTVSSGQALMRVFSPGYKTVATTTSTGSFTYTNILPANTVNLTATDPNAAEPGGLSGDTGTFTFTRNGDTSSALTVNYTVSGTATKGVDYVTNGASGTIPVINGAITFAPGESSTNITIDVIDDSLGEATETVIFNLTASANYFNGQSTATVNIADDGDLPSITVTNNGLGSYELLPWRPAKFAISTPIAYASDLVVNIGLTGTAVSGVDYTNPAAFTVTLLHGLTSTNFTVTPFGHSLTNNKTIIANVLTGSGYVLGVNTNATNILRADYLPPAPLLFSDNFETNSSTSWQTNAINSDNAVTFNYDYSLTGVPPAPHSSGGTTRGLRLQSHLGALSPATAISASPIGKNFAGDYRLRFDLWMNYNGPMPGGGAGSSEYFITGLGVSETKTNVAGESAGTAIAAWGSAGSTVMFSMDNDGGFAESTGDYIVFTNNVQIAASGTNIYPAGARDNFNGYYAEFGEIPAPAAQLANFSTQTGLGTIGSLSFSWHDVVITKIGSTYSWIIDGLPIASVIYTNATVGNNISLGYADYNTSITATPEMNMAIVDNLTVESLTVQQPVITAVALINAGANVQIDFLGAAANAATAFTLQSASDVRGPYVDVTATLTSTGTGTFRAIAPIAGGQQFYRIKQ